MLPAVFPLLSASSAVKAIIGSSPVRAYRHGDAPQNAVAPYVTWFVVSGTPENALSDLPPVDNYNVQVDCWSDSSGVGSTTVETLAQAVRDAIEPTSYMTSVISDGKDFDTQRYRIGMTFSFYTHRP
jgi:hypothetical protein